MNAVPPSMIPGAAGSRWAALQQAGDTVAALAGVQPDEPFDFPTLVGNAPEWRRGLLERGVEDMALAMQPGLAGLGALAARGVDPRSAALALWHEFVRSRDALLALTQHDRRTALDVVPGLFHQGSMAESSAALADMAPLFDRRAQAVTRGICRLFARNDIWALSEMPLRNGRRADIMGIDPKGRIVIVEIKTARGDLLGDGKWPDYLDFCDRFYWGLPPELDRACLEGADFRPDCCGVIVADEYDAEIVRPAPSHPLAAARRKAEVERLARTALRRLTVGADAECGGWGRAGG